MEASSTLRSVSTPDEQATRMRFAGVSSQAMSHYLSICKNSEGFSCKLRYTVCVTSCGHAKREKLTSGLSLHGDLYSRRPSDSCELHYFSTPACRLLLRNRATRILILLGHHSISGVIQRASSAHWFGSSRNPVGRNSAWR